MKIYKKEGNLVLDGEKALTLCHEKEYCIEFDSNVEDVTIQYFYYEMIKNNFFQKLKVLYATAKYIFKIGKEKEFNKPF